MSNKKRKPPKNKKSNAEESISATVAEAPNDPVTEASNRYLWFDDRTSYLLLVVCVVSQLVTVAITWPVWQARVSPVNLPWIATTPQLSMGVPMVVSLLLVLVAPQKIAMVLHLGVLLAAIAMDQFRCQPQVISIAALMAACVFKSVRQLCVWYLISIWLWTGIHKVLSPDWFGYSSVDLLKRLRWVNPYVYHVHFAVLVAASEIGIGVLAVLRPPIAALFCLALHLGIAIFLFVVNWNYSVLPWNLCTAVVGCWLLWNASTSTSGLGLGPKLLHRPNSKWQLITLVMMMILPAGIYFGLVRHCFAHVLYSDHLPIAAITRGPDEVEPLDGWDDFAVPFPHEKAAYVAYLKASGKPGQKLHVLDPRKFVKGGYFVVGPNRQVKEIGEQAFFSSDPLSEAGIAVDDPGVILELELAGVRMRKRKLRSMVFAAILDPQKFTPGLVDLLAGLPNLEEVQFRGCSIEDQDVKKLLKLSRLKRVGFDDTPVTLAGIKHLRGLESLELIQFGGADFTSVDEALAVGDQ